MKPRDIKDYFSKADSVEITLILISIGFIVIALVAPIIFTRISFSGISFVDTGSIGDTIGGLMNPFVSISAVLVTFLAFYIQYKANKQQLTNFRKELDLNKFENQYYEMLRLHKENVNEINISILSLEKEPDGALRKSDSIQGREVFQYFLEEMNVAYKIIKLAMPDRLPEEILVFAYRIFFLGVENFLRGGEGSARWVNILNTFNKLNSVGSKIRETSFKEIVREKGSYEPMLHLKNQLFIGRSAALAHYYRHLFHTVKFVTQQPESIASYEEKRNYLRILRSQLSSHEQVMLLYNWKSDFGRNWENETNKFFSNYRMIHNINRDLILSDFKLENIFHDEIGNLRKEKGRDLDPMFEFEDWA